jgi:glycine cleavage system H lipoate-binding protein
MGAILETLTTIGVFVAGIAARLGIVLAVMIVLAFPILAIAAAARGIRALRLWAQGYRSAGGVRFRAGLSYAPGHTWVRPEGTRLLVGLDDLAQKIFPWAVAIDLPAPGRKVSATEPVARISAGGREARVAAPVSGTVVAVNTSVAREPTLVKSDGYGRGWMYAIEPDDRSWRELLTGEGARDWLRAEAERLSHFYEEQLGLAAADGGTLLGHAPSLMSEERWRELTKEFLRT